MAIQQLIEVPSKIHLKDYVGAGLWSIRESLISELGNCDFKDISYKLNLSQTPGEKGKVFLSWTLKREELGEEVK